MDVMFLFGDSVTVVETTNDEKRFWVTSNNLDPFGTVAPVAEIIANTKGVDDMMDALRPKGSYKHLGKYCATWEEIWAAACYIENEPPEKWPTDDEYPRVPYALRDIEPDDDDDTGSDMDDDDE